MKPTRVLILDKKDGGGGGAGKYLYNLAEVLLRAGYTVDVAFLLASDDPSLRDQLRDLGASVYDILEKDFAAETIASWVRDFVDANGIEVLHVNSGGREMRAVIDIYNRLPAGKERRLFTLHGMLESPESIENWSLQDRLPLSWKRKKRRYLSEFLSAFDYMISVSRNNADQSRQLYRLEQCEVRFVPNGVDTKKYSPAHPANRKAFTPPIKIGSCGRLYSQKRLDILIQAFAELQIESNCELLLAGSGPEEQILRELVQSLHIAERTHFVGHVEGVSAFLQQLDVFVMTSDREGLPYALLEAMACGLPCVVTRVNDLPYVVRDGQDGFVIPADDVAACKERVHQIVTDIDLWNQMSKNARERICDEYSNERWAERTLAVYKEAQRPN